MRGTFGITQQELCEAAGVSRVSMVAYDSGTAFPSRNTCKRLDDALVGIVERRVMEEAKAAIAERLAGLPSEYVPDAHAGQPPGPELTEEPLANVG